MGRAQNSCKNPLFQLVAQAFNPMITTSLIGRVAFWITLFIVLSHMNEGVCMRNLQELVLSYHLVAPRVPHVVGLVLSPSLAETSP